MSYFRAHPLLSSLCALAILLLCLFFLKPLGLGKAPDPEDYSLALQQLQEEMYFTFQENCYLNTQGETREYFVLSGEKAAPDCHIEGRILGTEANVYLVEDTLYQQLEDGTWLVNAFPDIQHSASLFTELDPASLFLPGGTIVDEPKREGKLWYAEYVPEGTGWLGNYFTDIRYGLWLDKHGRLQKAELNALLLEDGESVLSLELIIPEYQENLVLSPPSMENTAALSPMEMVLSPGEA